MDLDDIPIDQCGYIRENATYRRLHSYGLCDRGYIPKFHGSIEDIDTEVCGMWLLNFMTAEIRPCAIFMEYLPSLGEVSSTVEWNFTKERWKSVQEIISLMHTAHVHYGRTFPKTMLVSGGNLERILCHDFDVSVTLQDRRPLSDEEKHSFDNESIHIIAQGETLVSIGFPVPFLSPLFSGILFVTS